MNFVILTLLVLFVCENQGLSEEEMGSFKSRDCFILKGTCKGEELTPSVSVSLDDSAATLIFETNGVPDHDTAEISSSPSETSKYRNYIKEKQRTIQIPNNPQRATDGSTICAGMGPIGIARNGVALFNAYSGTCSDAYMDEKIGFDSCNGHPAPDGTYHYHVTPICLEGYEDAFRNREQYFIGVAYDGFPVYSGYDSSGIWVTEDKLDECGGYVDEDDGLGYRYVTSGENPYLIGCFVGDQVLTRTGPCKCEDHIPQRRLLAADPDPQDPGAMNGEVKKAQAFGGKPMPPRINARPGVGMGPGHRPPMMGPDGKRVPPPPRGPDAMRPQMPNGGGMRPRPNTDGMRPQRPNGMGPQRPNGMRPGGGRGRQGGPGGMMDNRSECSTQSMNMNIGGTRDKHNCLGAAGEMWCESKSKCLRIWEEGCDDPQIEMCQAGPVISFEKELWGNPDVYSQGVNRLTKPNAQLHTREQTCDEKKTEELSKGFVGSYVPQCDDEGDYLWIQFWGSTGDFWCVGSTVTGERRKGLDEDVALMDRDCTDPELCCEDTEDDSLSCSACEKAMKIDAYCARYNHEDCEEIASARIFLQKNGPHEVEQYFEDLPPELKALYLAGAVVVIFMVFSFGIYRIGSRKHRKQFRDIRPQLYTFPGRTQIDDVKLLDENFSMRREEHGC